MRDHRSVSCLACAKPQETQITEHVGGESLGCTKSPENDDRFSADDGVTPATIVPWALIGLQSPVYTYAP